MTADEAALPTVKPMPMIQVTAVREAPLPVPRPRYDGVTDWPGKTEGKSASPVLAAWCGGAALLLTMLVVSVIYGLIGAFA